jgi:hypothetical protein
MNGVNKSVKENKEGGGTERKNLINRRGTERREKHGAEIHKR